MLLSNGHIMAVPGDYFLHPHTGRLLPTAGNVAYDPVSSSLVFTTDLCAGTRRDRGMVGERGVCTFAVKGPVWPFKILLKALNTTYK